MKLEVAFVLSHLRGHIPEVILSSHQQISQNCGKLNTVFLKIYSISLGIQLDQPIQFYCLYHVYSVCLHSFKRAVSWISPPTLNAYELQVGSCTTGGPVAAQQHLPHRRRYSHGRASATEHIPKPATLPPASQHPVHVSLRFPFCASLQRPGLQGRSASTTPSALKNMFHVAIRLADSQALRRKQPF